MTIFTAPSLTAPASCSRGPCRTQRSPPHGREAPRGRLQWARCPVLPDSQVPQTAWFKHLVNVGAGSGLGTHRRAVEPASLTCTATCDPLVVAPLGMNTWCPRLFVGGMNSGGLLSMSSTLPLPPPSPRLWPAPCLAVPSPACTLGVPAVPSLPAPYPVTPARVLYNVPVPPAAGTPVP